MSSVSGLFVGVAVLDSIFHIDSPVVDNGKKTAHSRTVAAGGNAANAAVAFAASRLHNSEVSAKATVLTRLGEDSEAEVVRKELLEHGVNVVSLPGIRSTINSTVIVNSATGDRFVVSYGGEKSTSHTSHKPGVSPNGHDVVLVDGHNIDIALPIAKEARALGIPVVADGDLPNETTEALLRLSDAAIVSEEFLSGRKFHDVARALSDSGVSYVAATHGQDAVEAYALGEHFVVDVPRVDNVVCTLGAGDFFHGAFCRYIVEHPLGGSDSFRDALEYSSGVAGRSITTLGTRAWLYSYRELWAL